MKHTPGPWTSKGGTVSSEKQRTEYKSSTIIAVTWDETSESHANAALIAAAPEMYKELSILADCLKMADPKLWAKEIKGIEELLKKARGES